MCSMFEGTLEYGSFDASFNISRRGILDGRQANHPNPTKERDTEFSLLVIRDLFGNIKSLPMNYACHPVFYPARRSVSGEFPARLTQLIDTRYYGCTSLFFQSAGGDVRPAPTVIDGKFVFQLSFRELDLFAQNICHAVSEQVEKGLTKYEKLSIAADEFVIDLPIESKSLAELRSEAEELEKGDYNPILANARKIVNATYGTLPGSMPLTCQLIRLTDSLYIAAMGGEPCCGVKKTVKAALTDTLPHNNRQVIFIGYTDACAYIVDDQMLREGGYEPSSYLEYCMQGPFKPEVDEKYFAAFRDSFQRLQQ